MARIDSLVTGKHLKQFDKHGYFILPSIIPSDHIEIMKQVISKAINKRDEDVLMRAGTEELKDEHDGFTACSTDGKYFFFMHEDQEPEIKKLIFSSYIEQIVRAVLGETVYYTHSEIVVKRGQNENDTSSRTAFGWHQDSGYIPYQHTPYLSCWCALSDMTTENGTLSVLPIERNPSEDGCHTVKWWDKPCPMADIEFPCYEHRRQGNDPDMIGYFGSDPGVEVICPIGSIVVFSSLTLHRSSSNRTDQIRSAYNIQFSAVPLLNADGQSLRHKADPFIIASQTIDDAKHWQK